MHRNIFSTVTWQLGLVEREITAILKGHTQHQQSGAANARAPTQQVDQVKRHTITLCNCVNVY